MILERDDGKICICFEFFLPTATLADVDVPLLDRITTAKDAEEEGDEEDKKRMDLNEKVILELTARSTITSCGLRRACMGTRWVDGKP